MDHRLDEDELDDLQGLLGMRPDNLTEGERLLEQAVIGGVPDETLIRFLDRRFQCRRFTLVDHDSRLWIYDMRALSGELSSAPRTIERPNTKDTVPCI